MNRKYKVIINPNAGSGAIGKKTDILCCQINRILDSPEMEFTRSKGHATAIARAALTNGYETIVAVGGDGTVNEVVNGFFDEQRSIRPNAKLGIIFSGTGGDFVRTLDLPKDTLAAAKRIRNGRATLCDLGRLTFRTFGGQVKTRYFINIGGAGFGAQVVHSIGQSSKAMGAFVAYLSGLLKTLLTYTSRKIRIRIDDGSQQELMVNTVVVANGQYFGGGMWIAPQARIDDGLFEVVIIGNTSPLDLLANLSKLYNGSIASYAKVTIKRGKTVALASDTSTLVEVDGELCGTLPAKFEILSASINIIT